MFSSLQLLLRLNDYKEFDPSPSSILKKSVKYSRGNRGGRGLDDVLGDELGVLGVGLELLVRMRGLRRLLLRGESLGSLRG